MAPKLTVAVTFATDTSQSPNVRATDPGTRLETYWKCIFVSLVSAKLLGGAAVEPVVFHDRDIPPRYAGLFARFGIRHIKTGFSFRPPEHFSDQFIGSLYLLDAIQWFAANAADSDKILIIDPDCLVNGSLEPVAAFLDDVEACIYALRFPRAHVSNGQSLDAIASWLAGNMPAFAAKGMRVIGGEFLAMTGAGMRKLAKINAEIWDANLKSFAAGALYLRTDEHVLTAAFASPSLTRRDVGGEAVRRLWTTRSYYNLTELSRELPVWHMPTEKDRGFAALFDLLSAADCQDAARRVLGDRGALLRLFGFDGRIAEKIICEIYISLKLLGNLLRGRAAEFEGHS